MRFDLLSLKLFVSVCEQESIARAAEMEHIAASAVSKRISDLEKMLKAPLFYRSPKGLELTPTAQALLHHARILLRDIRQMEAELGEHSKGVRGQIRISASVSTIVQYLPRDLSDFLASHVGVRIELVEATSQEVVRAVADNAVDIGIFGGSLPAAGLTVLPYRSDRLVVIMPPDHALAGRSKVTFAEIAEHDVVGPQEGSFLELSRAPRRGRSQPSPQTPYSRQRLRNVGEHGGGTPRRRARAGAAGRALHRRGEAGRRAARRGVGSAPLEDLHPRRQTRSRRRSSSSSSISRSRATAGLRRHNSSSPNEARLIAPAQPTTAAACSR